MKPVKHFKTNAGREAFFRSWLQSLASAYNWMASKKPVQLDLLRDEKGILPGCQEERKLVQLMSRPEIQGFALFNPTREELKDATRRSRR